MVLLGAVSGYSAERLRIPADTGAGDGTGKISVTVDKNLQGIVPLYLQRRNEDVKALNHAVEKLDYESIRVLGHSMKGSGGGYGFDNITEIGNQLEMAARNRDLTAVRERINELAQYLSRITVIFD
jgi:HPt (histidine-containing phosphotransfer) domain-containing protein